MIGVSNALIGRLDLHLNFSPTPSQHMLLAIIRCLIIVPPCCEEFTFHRFISATTVCPIPRRIICGMFCG
jgi:hypothetical protein